VAPRSGARVSTWLRSGQTSTNLIMWNRLGRLKPAP
jgi:hypothetical protein